MADDLRGKWKETGIGLGHAFRDLGKTIIKSGATAVKKADDWANKEENAEATTDAGCSPEVDAQKDQAVEQAKNFCGNCGSALDKGAKFCPNCGTAV